MHIKWEMKIKHLPPKCGIPGANIPKQGPASRANENLQIYLRIFIEKSFLSKAFMAPDNLR